MLMNFSSKKKAVHATPVLFPGRTGHRAARINDSIFVLGGTDKSGKFISEVHRINCLNNKIDTLIVENSISIEGFSLFSYQETLFIWGGLHLRQHMNQLLQFDGTKFIPLKQHGAVPKPRAYHASTTFGGKFLILFAGSDGQSFFNDWNLLNLKTLEWKSLKPSLEIKYNLGCSMVWAGGRGILLVNQLFDEQSNSIISNNFYQFYVSDYNTGQLKILPLQISANNSVFQEYIFNHMTVSDHNSVLIFGGYKTNSHTELHNLSYILSLDHLKLQRTKFKYKEKSEFESVYHKNKLYIVGGIISKDAMEDYVEIYENQTDKHHFKRHVCTTCKLYFDEEWFKSSKEVFPSSRIKEQYDYNYHLRIDNRILAKFSTYITNQLYALTLLISSLKTLSANQIQISFQKIKQNYSAYIPEIVDQTYQFIKIACMLGQVDTSKILHELLMVKQRESEEYPVDNNVVELAILRLKIACFRLGRSCLLTIKQSKQQVCVIYFSCCQIECTYSNFSPFNNYHYIYNLKTRQCSSNNNQHIIYENVKHIIKNRAEYEEIGENSMSIISFCGEEIQSELNSFQQVWDPETGETCPIGLTNKQENRKIMPLLQFSFLPTTHHSNVFIEQSPINFINILELLKGDLNSNILSRIDKYSKCQSDGIFDKIELFNYPSEYWFRRLLVYHSHRLMMHFEESTLNICGVIVLKEEVELDLSGNRFAKLEDEMKLKDIIKDLNSIKRPFNF